MSKHYFFFFFVFASCNNDHQKQSGNVGNVEMKKNDTKVSTLKNLSSQFDSVNTLVRDNKISRAVALKQFQKIIPQIKTDYTKQGKKNNVEETWTFPLQGYSYKAIGSKNGEGYISKSYDYFDGNKHGGHPAQDIFIQDKNQDCKDDKTGKYVNVISLNEGVVVSTESNWNSLSKLRGGKYIWIYNLTSNSLFYYAHNNQVLVSVGQILKSGDIIATVGRSGLNAYKKRSPTHLHISQLKFDKDFYPKPVDLYQTLLKVKSQ